MVQQADSLLYDLKADGLLYVESKSIINAMLTDKTFRTELARTFLVDGLPEPLERNSSHLQIFDNYIHETQLRLRSIRLPETNQWTHLLQKRYPAGEYGADWRIEEIELSETEYEHFKPFEGNEIRKNRYFAEVDGGRFEFDVYLGPLWGLIRARVLFASREEMDRFTPPDLLTFEVTVLQFFDDANLVNCKFEDVRAELAKSGQAPLSTA